MESFINEVAAAVAAATGASADEVAPLIQSSKDASRGDLAIACFKLAAILGKPGKDGAQGVAEDLAAKLPGSGVVQSAEAAGPYVNLRLDPAEVARRVLGEVHGSEAYGASDEGAGKTILIDFSSPNIAKPFHLGHLRSTVIGWSLRQTFRLLGYEVVGINHLGDWGTQFGLQIAAWKRWEDEAQQRIDGGEPEVEVFVDLYQRINKLAADEPGVKDEGREWFLKLEAGDEEAHRLWHYFVERSKLEFDRIYALLGVTHESEAGEAFYNDKMPATIERLQSSGILTPGLTRKETAEQKVGSLAGRLEKAKADLAALQAKVEGEPSGKQKKKLAKLEKQLEKLGPELEQARSQVPAEDDGLRPQGVDLSAEHLGFCMLLKGDGGTTYTTRDVTAAYYRAQTYQPHKIIYVVGEAQRDHFLPWFKLIEKLGEPWAAGLVHVGFGKYLGMSTRKGTSVFLEQVLEHARECARKAADATSKKIELSDDEKEEIARAIGISAVKFFDLRAERLKDIDLSIKGSDGEDRVDLDRILSWREDPETGEVGFGRDSGPYLQFAHARLAGILRKAPAPPSAEVDFAILDDQETQALIRLLATFPGAVKNAAERYEPSVISRYVLELAAATHSWLQDHNVLAPTLSAEQEAAGRTAAQLSAARLLVVACVKAVLKQALFLLGIDAREKM